MSSNRHWPSMFKLKPSAPRAHQWNQDQTASSSYSEGASAQYEERSSEPKPRWNPKPEQIRILEEIFNSGMVNPPRDEIRRIRIQLQQYGQVGDANVFYWFQNRKSRTKQKRQCLQTTERKSAASDTPKPSSNDQSVSAPSIGANISSSFPRALDYHHLQLDQLQTDQSNISIPAGTLCPDQDTDSRLFDWQPLSANPASLLNEGNIHGECNTNNNITVFINDVAFEIAMAPLNVRAAFGEDAVLVHSSGQPVLMNEWGITLQSLQHGAMYYLI